MEEFVDPAENEFVGLCPEEEESEDDLKSMKDFLGNNEKEGMSLSEGLEFPTLGLIYMEFLPVILFLSC